MRCVCARLNRPCRSCYPSKRCCCENSEGNDSEPESGDSNTTCFMGNSSSVTGPVQQAEACGPNRNGGLSFPSFEKVEYGLKVGNLVGESLFQECLKIYEEVCHWKVKLMRVPTGSIGREFVSELSDLFREFGERGDPAAFLAAFIMPKLLLQSPPQSESRAKKWILEVRLEKWKDGLLDDLMQEGRAIQKLQQRSFTGKRRKGSENVARSFANLMFEGKVDAALKIISDKIDRGGVLHMGDIIDGKSVRSILRSKHPSSYEVCNELVLPDREGVECNQSLCKVVFDSLDASAIRRAALATRGAGGPSAVDAYVWRRLCTGFGKVSDGLCNALAMVGRFLCSSYIDPQVLLPFLACRLIAIDKNPGVRPIGIGEVVRRIIAKAVIRVVKPDVLETVGCKQLCVGQVGGVEAAIHSVRELFDGAEAAIFVDASNAFKMP